MIKPWQIENKSKRIRKKLFLGEFKEAGFYLKVFYKEPITEEQSKAETYSLFDFMQENDWSYMAYHDPNKFTILVNHKKPYRQLTYHDRGLLVNWIQNNPLVESESMYVSELLDMYYDEDFEPTEPGIITNRQTV